VALKQLSSCCLRKRRHGEGVALAGEARSVGKFVKWGGSTMPAGFFEGRPERNLFGRLMAELI
ncbi:MAG TPA: hypothetical protein IAD18_05785, partial [Candidatus Limisoma intestinavium]|nr:hypothetical protein [Candidatus Limisoma intestinavium]